jgi:hypothetical protein
MQHSEQLEHCHVEGDQRQSCRGQAWLCETAFKEGRQPISCTCNRSHSVLYTHGSHRHPGTDVIVHGVGAARALPKLHSGTPNYLLYLEPPHNLEFTSAPGFSGLVGFRRPAHRGDSERVWHPWCSFGDVQRELRQWKYDRTRDSIGVWVSNCDGYPTIWRTSVIDALLASGLNVISYGDCRRNTPKRLWGERVHGPDGVSAHCRRHRLMLAVENNACRDWISQNLCQAVAACGAIPIIKSAWDPSAGALLPDYRALYGDSLPLVNASQPGWLAEVRELMLNDTAYHLKVASSRHAFGEAKGGRGGPATDGEPGNVHCQWVESQREPQPGGAQWSQCACPRGHRSEFDFLGNQSSWPPPKLAERWLPTCLTAAA